MRNVLTGFIVLFDSQYASWTLLEVDSRFSVDDTDLCNGNQLLRPDLPCCFWAKKIAEVLGIHCTV